MMTKDDETEMYIHNLSTNRGICLRRHSITTLTYIILSWSPPCYCVYCDLHVYIASGMTV